MDIFGGPIYGYNRRTYYMDMFGDPAAAVLVMPGLRVHSLCWGSISIPESSFQ